jgi:hypothetical protein
LNDKKSFENFSGCNSKPINHSATKMALIQGIEDLFKSIYELFASVIGAIANVFGIIISTILSFFTGIFSMVGDVFKGVVDVVGGVTGFVLSELTSNPSPNCNSSGTNHFLAGNIVVLLVIAAGGYIYMQRQQGRPVVPAKKTN